jgi:hypothetical protein
MDETHNPPLTEILRMITIIGDCRPDFIREQLQTLESFTSSSIYEPEASLANAISSYLQAKLDELDQPCS